MLHLPILRQGVPYKSLDVVRVPHYQTREPFVEISQANAGLIRRDLAAGAAGGGAAGAGADAVRAADRDVQRGGGSLSERQPAARRRRTVAGRLRAAAVGDDRDAARAGAAQHAAGRRRDAADEHGAGRADPRARSLRPRHRLRRARRPRPQLLSADRRARRGAAEQFAGRALAVGAGDRLEDPAGPEAGQRRAVDAVPDCAGVHEGRMPAGGVQLLPRRPCRRR